jgi:arginine decarboxylase
MTRMYYNSTLDVAADDNEAGVRHSIEHPAQQTLSQVLNAGLARTKCCTPLTMPSEFSNQSSDLAGLNFQGSPLRLGDGPDGLDLRALSGVLNRLDQSVSNAALDDALGRGTGPMGRLARRLADAFGAECVRHAPHGSSLANVALLLAMNSLTSQRLKLAVDRSCHKSLVAGLALINAEIIWIERDVSRISNIPLPLNAERLGELLKDHGDLHAVFITSPTYEGFSCAEPDAISALFGSTHTHLIVDSAWGAYEGLIAEASFPDAIGSFASASVVSSHKKGIGLSGASFVTFNNDALCAAFERFCDLGFVSTSPNFLGYMVLEHCLDFWASPQGKTCAAKLVAESQNFRQRLGGIEGVRVINANDLGLSVAGDPSHVLIDIQKTGKNGKQVADYLAQHHLIDVEMVIANKILFLFGPDHIDKWPMIADAFETALNKLALEPSPREVVAPSAVLGDWRGMHDAVMMPTRLVLPEDAIGCMAAFPISAYPPGRPLIHPGERFSKEIIDYLITIEAAGARLIGVNGALHESGFTVADERS